MSNDHSCPPTAPPPPAPPTAPPPLRLCPRLVLQKENTEKARRVGAKIYLKLIRFNAPLRLPGQAIGQLVPSHLAIGLG